MAERDSQRDLTLAPGEYLYLQNIGKGGILTVHCGPCVVSQTGQDQPVKYDPAKKEYVPCDTLEKAVQKAPIAPEGHYVILENPAEDGTFPKDTSQQAHQLKVGRRMVIPGPFSKPLWPGQSAKVVPGHQLRSNQYLIAVVYNADEAEKNWDLGTIVKAKSADPPKPNEGEGASLEADAKINELVKDSSFTVGTRIVIPGSDVSFFMPPTGIEVVPDPKNNEYVREAVTLEALEFCCLIDENGKKEYFQGPMVVFPKPTQVFDEDKRGRRKFRPIELNTINGLHLKVTKSFTGPDLEKDISKERQYNEGEELFITGNTVSIYYPREELTVVEYGRGMKKHLSTAIPLGEGRYVTNRQSGDVRLVKGPRMFLADPRTDIPVRRVLSQDECSLLYPGNQDALNYNKELAQAMADSPSGRSGVVSEGDWRKSQIGRGLAPTNVLEAAYGALYDEFEPEEVSNESAGPARRSNRSGQPQVLNTKFDGVPKVDVWPGYAVLIVGADGKRRVEQGPKIVLLEFHEKVGFLSLSTGTPKTSDKIQKTAYLKTAQNQVSDVVNFESKDHVKGTLKISMRVNFEAETDEDKLKWFGHDNYVKLLTDHVRSILGGIAKKTTIADLMENYVEIVRSAILGAKASAEERRPGLAFDDNGMRIVEVEVLDIALTDKTIAQLLDKTQHEVVQSAIQLEGARRQLQATKEKEEIEQQSAAAAFVTVQVKNDLARKGVQEQIDTFLASFQLELKKLESEFKKAEAKEKSDDFTSEKRLLRAKAEADHKQAIDEAVQMLKLQGLTAETQCAVDRLTAAKDGLYEVIVAMGRDDLAAKSAQAVNIERFITGSEPSQALMNILTMSPSFKGLFDRANAMAEARGNGNGVNRLTETSGAH